MKYSDFILCQCKLRSRRQEGSKRVTCYIFFQDKHLASVVQTLDSTIHRIKVHPMDNAIGFPNTYPPDSDLSGG